MKLQGLETRATTFGNRQREKHIHLQSKQRERLGNPALKERPISSTYVHNAAQPHLMGLGFNGSALPSLGISTFSGNSIAVTSKSYDKTTVRHFRTVDARIDMTDYATKDGDLSGSRPPRTFPPAPAIRGESASSASPYSPIDPGTDTIRLLRLEGSQSGAIRGSLIHCPLSSDPKYTALSYAWGSPDDPKEISINGITVSVRQNL